MKHQTIRLGISTCPNDTFAFHGLMKKCVDWQGLDFEIQLLDIQELNNNLLKNRFDIAKASFHAALLLPGRLRNERRPTRPARQAGLQIQLLRQRVLLGGLFAMDHHRSRLEHRRRRSSAASEHLRGQICAQPATAAGAAV